MGEVYRARDTRLDRTVAIKILPAHLSSNPEAKQRFDREARAISSLNHPNICTLYDVGHQNGIDYLVMEFLEGETLADRLVKGPLPPEQVLKGGIEICEGLEKAHRGGVTHRDLKPGNVMLTRSGAKLMDFGLAKASSRSDAPASGLTLTSPVASRPLTQEGMVVGTFQYMSPEQIEGKEADARSDIFALGAVLYEMATGKRAFEGKSTTSVIAAILERNPPPISAVQPMFPRALDSVVKTCLEKDPDERWQSAHDVKVQLKSIATSAGPLELHPGRRNYERLIWIAALFLGAVVGGLAFYFLSAKPPAQPAALSILPPPGMTLNFSGLYGPPTISPDGAHLAVVGSDGSGTRTLWLRSLDRTSLTPLPGTEGASYPFWSPDGKQIGFFTNNFLKIVDVAGRSVMDLCPVAEGRGGTWNNRGEIVFGSRTTGLFRVPASGGTAAPLTNLTNTEKQRFAANHRFPVFLPDNEHIAYVVQSPPSAQVQLISLHDPRPVELPGIISNVAFNQGRIFHVRADGTLLAQGFDFKRFSLEPNIEVVAKPVGYDGQFNYAAFSVSPQGAIAYEEGAGSTTNELVQFDRTGKEVGKLPALNSYSAAAGLRISPQGDQLLYVGTGGTRTDIWVAQLSRATRTRISLESQGGAFGTWSPDGRRVAYQNGVGGDSIIVRTSDGLGSEQVVAKMQGTVSPRGWSADGNYIVFEYWATDSHGPGDIWVAPLKPGEAPHALVRNISSFGTDLSPDGKWLAYTSEESGRLEVYVIPFSPVASSANALAAGRWQISFEGGSQPRWSPSGKELFFTNPSATTLYVTSIKAEAGKFESSNPSKLFDLPLHPSWAFYDIGRDGNIYMFRYVGRQGSALTMLLNWRPSGQ
jgi:eukaryotic-like serine/threonine-protein kinase